MTVATGTTDQIVTALRRSGGGGLDKVELAQETGLDASELRDGLGYLMGEEAGPVVGERGDRFVLLREDGEFPVPGEQLPEPVDGDAPAAEAGPDDRTGNLARAQIIVDVMFDPGEGNDLDVEAVKGARTLTEETATALAKLWPSLEVGAKIGTVEVFGAPRRVWPR